MGAKGWCQLCIEKFLCCRASTPRAQSNVVNNSISYSIIYLGYRATMYPHNWQISRTVIQRIGDVGEYIKVLCLVLNCPFSDGVEVTTCIQGFQLTYGTV